LQYIEVPPNKFPTEESKVSGGHSVFTEKERLEKRYIKNAEESAYREGVLRRVWRHTWDPCKKARKRVPRNVKGGNPTVS